MQGRLGDDFGKLTIRDQPETNTIQKIMALKDALTSLEDFLQKANIALLKLRTVALSRHLDVSDRLLLCDPSPFTHSLNCDLPSSIFNDFCIFQNDAAFKVTHVGCLWCVQSTNEVLWSLLAAGIVSWFVPFRYLLAAVLVDQFTADLPFRRKSVEEFFNRVNDWWSMIPATPVEVLPPENTSNTTDAHLPESNQGEAVLQALSEWLGDDQ